MSFNKKTYVFESTKMPSWDEWWFFCRFTYDKIEELKKANRKIKTLQTKLKKASEK